ncbi:carboxypeptidase regulatory-like domain-containing protein [Luteibaculum oceani]|uniref:OmpA family protein n=1 Tax=Luteibaculum oceani TaxID=1294296 RepID=A0A5C6VPX4_9FLAO|nr:carboxypeptidase regulatory-like domain-containing protein [Luteibaculum oceani]TXC85438.1 OmpA family protein [Luteibaculum oceani]
MTSSTEVAVLDHQDISNHSNMNLTKRLAVVLAILISSAAFGQFKLLDRANQLFEDEAYFKAAQLYLDIAYTKDRVPDEAIHNLAYCFNQMRDFEQAEVWYAQAVQLRSRTPMEVYYYAQMLKANGKYAEANNWMRLFQELKPEDTRGVMHNSAGDYVRKLSPIVHPYKISNAEVNTEGPDFGAAFFGENSVVFSSSGYENPAILRTWAYNGGEFLDLYVSDRVAGGALTTPELLSKSLNTKFHEGSASFSADGLQIYFTRGGEYTRSRSGKPKLKIYRATLAGNDFVNIEPLPFNSDEFNVAHPSLTKDGNKLYFASDMPGGYGGYDIYEVEYDRGFWGRPKNLGPTVNTEGNETFPFIHESNELYFASDGHVGLGGLDIFKVKYSRGVWRGVENMKKPINSSRDDFAFVTDSAKTFGYFSSNRKGGVGGDDIYAFIFDEQSEVYVLNGQVIDQNDFTVPNVTVYVKNADGAVLGRSVADEDGYFTFTLNRQEQYTLMTEGGNYTQTEVNVPVFPAGEVKNMTVRVEKNNLMAKGIIREVGSSIKLAGVEMTLIKSSSQQIQKTLTGPDGKFSFILDPNSTYTLKAAKPGFMAKSKIFSTAGQDVNRPIQVDDIFLERIRVNQVIEIPNVYYELGKWNITADAGKQLDKVVEFMQDNPSVSIELSSHTDSRGDANYNMELSQKRAQSAVDYIVSRGISVERILAKGYGEEKLKNNCSDGVACTEAEHKQNRRTEIRVIAINE